MKDNKIDGYVELEYKNGNIFQGKYGKNIRL